ncbi:alpha/beta fold hydrolase [Myxococcota bacterium]
MWMCFQFVRSGSACLLVTCTALAATACGDEDEVRAEPAWPALPVERIPDPTDAFQPGPCPFKRPAGYAMQCGYVEVPENRGEPNRGRLRLAVAIAYSPATDVAKDPIVYLEGGPGGQALRSVMAESIAFEHLLVDRDLIVLDQRGAGYSLPALDCREVDQLEADASDSDVVDALVTCRERFTQNGVDLSAYTSAHSAADVADLRTALGYQAWNLYGISYGSRLALTVLRDHPEGIRSVILDGVMPLEVSPHVAHASNMQRSFDMLFDRCQDDAVCNDAFPDLRARFFALTDRLNETEAALEFSDGSRATFTGDDLVWLFGMLLYSAELIPALPLLIDEVDAGDHTNLARILPALSQTLEINLGMYLSVTCAEELAFTTREAVAEIEADLEPHLRAVFADPAIFDFCDAWDVPAAPPEENQPVTSEAAALITSGEFDPVTPPEWGHRVAKSLSHGREFTLSGESHAASLGACGQRLVRDFLTEPDATSSLPCAARSRIIEFLEPYADVADQRLLRGASDFVTEWESILDQQLESSVRRIRPLPRLNER